MIVRPFEPRDRARALALLNDPRAIDSSNQRIVMAEGDEGLALWHQPDAGECGYLGPVLTARPDRQLFYRLVAGACRDAIDHGFTRGSFTIRNERLLHRLQRDFHIQPEPSGWEPNTGRPLRWRIEVDLDDALRQLHRVLSAPKQQALHA